MGNRTDLLVKPYTRRVALHSIVMSRKVTVP